MPVIFFEFKTNFKILQGLFFKEFSYFGLQLVVNETLSR